MADSEPSSAAAAREHVLLLGESILVDAPLDKVWKVVIDFASYDQWNPFHRTMRVVGADGHPLGDQRIKQGQLVFQQVNIPPAMTPPPAHMKATTRIAVLDHDHYVFKCETADAPKWFLHAERWYSLTADVEGKTKWETVETYDGIWAYVIRWFMVKNMKLSGRAEAEALKHRVENMS